MNLTNKIFELVENQNGVADTQTRLAFAGSTAPYKAIYTGTNIVYGQAIVAAVNHEHIMLYHALSTSGELMAGRAVVELNQISASELQLVLHWQWLTGTLTSGISKWKEINF